LFNGSAPPQGEAGALATADLLRALVTEKGFSEDHAYLLLTMTADLEVSQVVNELRTARVCIDRDFFEGLPSVV
jgi:acetamidase/formamidase